MSGQAGVDVMFGQDGADDIFGGSDDDYVEGQGHSETIYGDRSPADAGIPVPCRDLAGQCQPAYDEDTGPADRTTSWVASPVRDSATSRTRSTATA